MESLPFNPGWQQHAHPLQWQPKTSRHYQMSPGGQNHPHLRTTGKHYSNFSHDRLILPVVGFYRSGVRQYSFCSIFVYSIITVLECRSIHAVRKDIV